MTLRSRRKSDKDFTLSLWGDRKNGKYTSNPAHENVDEAYLKYVDEIEDSPEGYHLLAERKANAMPVGTCCISPKNGNCDIGYCIAKEYWEEDPGTEMVDATLRWAKTKGGKSITRKAADGNLPSIVLPRKSRFTEDRRTCYRKWDGEIYSDAHYYKLNLDGLSISLQC